MSNTVLDNKDIELMKQILLSGNLDSNGEVKRNTWTNKCISGVLKCFGKK